MSKVYLFSIDMTCNGCKNAVERCLSKDGKYALEQIECDWESQNLKVTTDVEDAQEDIIQLLSKWSSAANKTVEFVEAVDVDA